MQKHAHSQFSIPIFLNFLHYSNTNVQLNVVLGFALKKKKTIDLAMQGLSCGICDLVS